MTLQEKIQQLMEQHPDLFPTEASFWSYLRGCLRRGLWNKSPMKHRFKSSQMSPPPEDYKGRGKKGAYCELTGEWQMTSKMEVDHKDGHKSLLSEDDIVPYVIHLLASGNQELAVVDKEAHKIKSYAERKGISFEEAKVEKEIIQKMRLPKAEQDATLKAQGLPFGNDGNRREGWKRLLEQRGE